MLRFFFRFDLDFFGSSQRENRIAEAKTPLCRSLVLEK
jgi:hypothetical protein